MAMAVGVAGMGIAVFVTVTAVSAAAVAAKAMVVAVYPAAVRAIEPRYPEGRQRAISNGSRREYINEFKGRSHDLYLFRVDGKVQLNACLRRGGGWGFG